MIFLSTEHFDCLRGNMKSYRHNWNLRNCLAYCYEVTNGTAKVYQNYQEPAPKMAGMTIYGNKKRPIKKS